jgi:hypothetical protein
VGTACGPFAKRCLELNPSYANATPLEESFIRQEIAFGSEAEAKVSELAVSLYQLKLTYGEFAQRRYAIGKGGGRR